MSGLILSGVWSGLTSAVSSVFTFLTTTPGVYLLIAGIAAGAYWYSGHEGYARGVADTVASDKIAQAQAEAAAAKHGMVIQADLDKAMAQDAFAFGQASAKAQTEFVFLTKEVPSYVSPETDARYPVPCGLYRVLRAAGEGSADPTSVDLPAGLTDGDACPIAASDLADLGVAWASLYRKATAQIGGLQALARDLAKAAAQ